MKKWKEILSDKSTFPDDFTVSLKDGQVLTIGEMRAYDVEHEGAMTAHLTAKEQEIAKREKQVSDASIGLGQVVERVAAASGLTPEELLQGKAPTKKQVAQATELDEADPLVGTVVKEIRKLQARIDEVATGVEKTRKDALGPMLTTYLEDYYEGKWDKLEPTLPKGATVTRAQALEYAQNNGYKDTRGRLDLAKAVKDLTYDARVQAEAEKRVADLRKKDDDQRVLAAAPKPSGTHINVKPDKSLTNEKGQVKSLDEVMNDAFNDVEMWRGIISGQA